MFLDLTQPSILRHPQWQAAQSIAQVLRQSGHDVVLAGGCVRDFLLNRPAVDLDIATSARPEEVESLFEKTVAVGKAFGVIRVLTEGQEIEVASFRKDGLYVDGRRPENVEFSSPMEDAERRDFTINAMFLNPFTGEVLDYVGGLRDLNSCLIRAVGQAEKRFEEDHLRILRAVRFVAQLGFEIEVQTLKAASRLAPQILKISAERRLQELNKLLMGPFVEKSWAILNQLKLLASVSLAGSKWNYDRVNSKWFEPMQRYSSLGCWFALFIGSEAPFDEVMNFVKELKFSVKEQRHLQNAMELWGKQNELLAEPLGEWLVAHQQSGVLVFQLQSATDALSFGERQKREWALRVERFVELGEVWPPALLRGEHLQGYFAGAQLGQVLKWAYARQLEKSIKDVDGGVSICLEQFSKEKSNGAK